MNTTRQQPTGARYLGHVTGYQPIRDQNFLLRSVPVTRGEEARPGGAGLLQGQDKDLDKIYVIYITGPYSSNHRPQSQGVLSP